MRLLPIAKPRILGPVFFVFSKILAFLISPINWIFAFLLLAVFVRRPRLRRWSVVLAAMFFAFFTNGFLADRFLGLYEMDATARHELDRSYPAGILLGGLVHFQSDTTLVSFNANGDRLFQTLDLYKSGVIDRIVITSGSGLVQLPEFSEANLIRSYLTGIGIPDSALLIDARSRNTHENALYTAELLQHQHIKGPFLLITSASHMRRALGCFRKQGLNVIPYSTTARANKGPFVLRSENILPDPHALEKWKIFFYELTGIAVYRMRGYL